jgi:hypothetical protein
MAAPLMQPSPSNWISAYLPKRLLLSLRTVLALPNASSSGLLSSTASSTGRDWPPPLGPPCVLPPWAARYFMMSLVVSVFPAPDSPDTRMLWLHITPLLPASPPPAAVLRFKALYAASATAKTCGESSPRATPLY